MAKKIKTNPLLKGHDGKTYRILAEDEGDVTIQDVDDAESVRKISPYAIHRTFHPIIEDDDD